MQRSFTGEIGDYMGRRRFIGAVVASALLLPAMAASGDDLDKGAGVTRGAAPVATAAGPAAPPPPDLWRPSRTTGGTWVELDSQQGDTIGQGRHLQYDQTTAGIRLEHDLDGTSIRVFVDGDERWSGMFHHPDFQPLTEGFHGPFSASNSPFDWSRILGCGGSAGWFAIDRLQRAPDGRIEFLALRFEQRCRDQDTATLRGAVSYDHNDVLPAANNPRPSPGARWAPSAELIPDTDTYVIVQGQPGSWVGEYWDERAPDTVWTEAEGTVRVWLSEERNRPTTRWVLKIAARPPYGEDGDSWSGEFLLPRSLERPEEVRPGYYGRLTDGRNAVDGGMAWSGAGRGCGGAASGWFIIDDIELGGPVPPSEGGLPTDIGIESLALRFEQRCYSSPLPLLVRPAARGEVRFRSDAPRPLSRQRDVLGPEVRFSDVSAEAAHGESILGLARRGVVEGHADGSYRPAQSVTRAQLASLLVRGLQIDLPERATQRFSDVPANSAHAAAIDAAVDAGLIRGYQDGTFGPAEPVRRDQTAAIVLRSLDMPPDPAALFPELRRNVHEGDVTMLAKSLVLAGYPDGSFRPAQPLTRAQVASVLDRAMGQLD